MKKTLLILLIFSLNVLSADKVKCYKVKEKNGKVVKITVKDKKKCKGEVEIC